MKSFNPQETENLSFEEALNELQSIVSHLEKGELNLDDAVEKYERGVALKVLCEQKLREAKKRIQELDTSSKEQSDTSKDS